MMLYDRQVEVRIGPSGLPGLSWSQPLRIAFKVERTSSRMPNAAEIRMWNLSDITIGFIRQPGNLVQLLAGYPLTKALLFAGDIPKGGVRVARDGADRVVTIEAGEAELVMAQTEIDLVLGPGATTQQVLTAAAAAMGVGPGNLAELGASTVYQYGFAATGRVTEVLDAACRDIGATWSVQQGVLQVVVGDMPAGIPAALLTPETGLIGAPEVTDDGVNIRSLLQPSIVPHQPISVVSEAFTGLLKARKVTHVGDSRDGDFVTEIECKEIGP